MAAVLQIHTYDSEDLINVSIMCIDNESECVLPVITLRKNLRCLRLIWRIPTNQECSTILSISISYQCQIFVFEMLTNSYRLSLYITAMVILLFRHSIYWADFYV